jgi:hypothetical protein
LICLSWNFDRWIIAAALNQRQVYIVGPDKWK